jgi:hypothetical protein
MAKRKFAEAEIIAASHQADAGRTCMRPRSVLRSFLVAVRGTAYANHPMAHVKVRTNIDLLTNRTGWRASPPERPQNQARNVPCTLCKAKEDAGRLLNPRPCTQFGMAALYKKALGLIALSTHAG